jgi:hypothetical protein
MIDFVLNADNDIELDDEGNVVEGLSSDQEAYNHLRLVQGDLRHDPLVGLNFPKLIRSNIINSRIKALIEESLFADGFQYVKVDFKPDFKIVVSK